MTLHVQLMDDFAGCCGYHLYISLLPSTDIFQTIAVSEFQKFAERMRLQNLNKWKLLELLVDSYEYIYPYYK